MSKQNTDEFRAEAVKQVVEHRFTVVMRRCCPIQSICNLLNWATACCPNRLEVRGMRTLARLIARIDRNVYLTNAGPYAGPTQVRRRG